MTKPGASPDANSAILLVDCPDRKGIVAAIANFIYDHGGNILHADQHQDSKLGRFFMRVEWDLNDFDLCPEALSNRFGEIGNEFQMAWRIAYSREPQAVAIFVSHHLHCLVDLLHRYRTGELRCRIRLIISNHSDGRGLAEFYGIPFHHIPVNPARKPEAEQAQYTLLESNGIGLVVLARYMQILSPKFVAHYPQRIINVHHSFLPAFSCANPYHAAFDRGVKLIGATSHYVTDVLDDGPIIEQDVIRISHRDQVEDLIQKGRNLERLVLARALRWHLEHRVLCYGNKTVVFD